MALKSLPTPLLILGHRGVDRVWLLWWMASWVAAVAFSRIGIPPVAPQGTGPGTATLAQLGAIGLCLPLVSIAALIRDRSPWLSLSSPRALRAVRTAAITLIIAVAISTAMLAALFYPPGIPWLRVLCLFAVLLSITLIAGGFLNPSWAALPAPAFVTVATFQGLLPWEWNIVYNPETDATLYTSAAGGLLSAFLAGSLKNNYERV